MRAAFGNGFRPSRVGAALFVIPAAAALLGWVMFADGLPGDRAVSLVGSAAVLGALGCALVAGLPLLDRKSTAAVGSLGLLVAWVAISIAWSIASDRSWGAANLGLAAFAFAGLGLGLAAASPERATRNAAAIAVLIAGLAVGWALLGLVVPSLFPGGDLVARLREPIGHAPALALVTGTAIPIAGWLLSGGRGAPRWCAGVGLAYAATVATMLTQSRAGIVAALVVIVLWAVLAGDPLARLVTLLPAVLPGLVVAGVAFTQPRWSTTAAARADRVHAGWIFALVIAAGAAAALALSRGLDAAGLARRHRAGTRRAASGARRRRRRRRRRRARRRRLGVLGWGVHERPEPPARCLREQPARLVARGLGRLRRPPVGGTGALTFAVARTRVRESSFDVAQPHSVPLQLLADLGLVGLALALAGTLALALAVRSAFRRLEGEERVAAAAIVGLPVAFGIHGLFDYDADFLAVVAPTAFAVTSLLAAGRPTRRLGLGVAPAAVVVAGIAIASLALPYLSARAIDAASRASDRGDDARATQLARRAERLDPLSLAARFAQADVATDDAVAERALLAATRLQPENAATWYELGVFRSSSRSAATPAERGRAQPRVHARSAKQEVGRGRSARPGPRRREPAPRLRVALGRAGYVPRMYTTWAPCSSLFRIPSSGPTTRTPRSRANRRPSPAKPVR